MQITPLLPGRPTAEPHGHAPAMGAGRAESPAPGTSVAPASQASQPRAQPINESAAIPQAASPRSGLRAAPPQLNQQVSRAQQSIGYLVQLQARLDGLKRDLAAHASAISQAVEGAADVAPPDALVKQLADFNALWQQRPQATGGGLDQQLRFQPEGQSRQVFKVRGLDAATLERPEKETLSFTTGSDQADRRIVTAVLDANQPMRVRLNKLDQTLGVVDIRIHANAQGELSLSAPETNWPAVQGSFGVRGGGIRFPASQFHRLKLEPEQAALSPETWKLGSAAALRQTLQGIVQAQQLVRQSQARLSQTLTDLGDKLGQQSLPVDGAWAQSFVEDFQRIGQQPAYAQLRAIGPAVLGISRERVGRLLAAS